MAAAKPKLADRILADLARRISWSAGAVAARAAERRWRRPLAQRPHGLPGPLVVSLTSYGPRLETLHLTLKCLLRQTVRPDRIVLWLADADVERLPESARAMTAWGVEIATTADLGPYKKIIPALRAWPEAFLVTADDDAYYHARWLEELVAGWDGDVRQVVARRARNIRRARDGGFQPYRRWSWRHGSGLVSTQILPIGVGGVLFPPGSLAPEACDEASFMALCPRADDLWLYWMARRAGSRFRKVARQGVYLFWPRTQDVGLSNTNRTGGNDAQIKALIERYGLPGA